MEMIHVIALVLLTILTPDASGPNVDGAREHQRRIVERAAIVPRVDHHRHIVGPRAAIHWPPR